MSKKNCPVAGSVAAVSKKSDDYRGIGDSTLYIATQTWPDKLATVRSFSRFLENPEKVHWLAAKRILFA